jgi:hypothetical protein
MSLVAAAAVPVQRAQHTCQRLQLEEVLGTSELVLAVGMAHGAERKPIPLMYQLDPFVSEAAVAAHVGLPS